MIMKDILIFFWVNLHFTKILNFHPISSLMIFLPLRFQILSYEAQALIQRLWKCGQPFQLKFFSKKITQVLYVILIKFKGFSNDYTMMNDAS